MLAQIPEPAAASSVEYDARRSARADGSFEFGTPAPSVAAMLGTSELGLQRTQKERPLHEHNSTRKHRIGAMFICRRYQRVAPGSFASLARLSPRLRDS